MIQRVVVPPASGTNDVIVRTCEVVAGVVAILHD